MTKEKPMSSASSNNSLSALSAFWSGERTGSVCSVVQLPADYMRGG